MLEVNDAAGQKNSCRTVASWVTLVLAALLVGVAVAAVLNSVVGHRGHSAATEADDDLFTSPHIIFRSLQPGPDYQRIAYVPAVKPGSQPRLTSQRCLRVAAAAQRAVCLRASLSPASPYDVVLLDDRLNETGQQPLGGIPSRARFSADGQRWATTVFVSGHSYSSIGFSTETVIHEQPDASGANLEDYALMLNGNRNTAADRNIWGVTFAADANTFYATAATGGNTYLVRGDIHARTLTTLRDNVECPSLSPDQRTIVYKKLVDPSVPGVWQLHALDLASGQDTRLGERRSVDDQVAWLDSEHVMYAINEVHDNRPSADIWLAPINADPPRILVHDADSPTVVGVT